MSADATTFGGSMSSRATGTNAANQRDPSSNRVPKPGEWICAGCGIDKDAENQVCGVCGDPGPHRRVIPNRVPIGPPSTDVPMTPEQLAEAYLADERRATPDRVYVTMQWTTPGSEPVEVLVRLVTAETRPAQIIPFKRRTRS